jgi:hypothetical protein
MEKRMKKNNPCKRTTQWNGRKNPNKKRRQPDIQDRCESAKEEKRRMQFYVLQIEEVRKRRKKTIGGNGK